MWNSLAYVFFMKQIAYKTHRTVAKICAPKTRAYSCHILLLPCQFLCKYKTNPTAILVSQLNVLKIVHRNPPNITAANAILPFCLSVSLSWCISAFFCLGLCLFCICICRAGIRGSMRYMMAMLSISVEMRFVVNTASFVVSAWCVLRSATLIPAVIQMLTKMYQNITHIISKD